MYCVESRSIVRRLKGSRGEDGVETNEQTHVRTVHSAELTAGKSPQDTPPMAGPTQPGGQTRGKTAAIHSPQPKKSQQRVRSMLFPVSSGRRVRSRLVSIWTHSPGRTRSSRFCDSVVGWFRIGRSRSKRQGTPWRDKIPTEKRHIEQITGGYSGCRPR